VAVAPKITSFKETEAYFEAAVEAVADVPGDKKKPGRAEPLGGDAVRAVHSNSTRRFAPEVLVSLNQIEEPSKLADTVASHLNLKIPEKQELL